MPPSLTTTERFEKFIESDPWRKRRVAVALGAVLVGIDYFSGPEIIIPIYFIVPVMLLAWNWGARTAVGLAVLLCATHLCFLHLWAVPEMGVTRVVNALLRSGVLMMLAVMTARLGTQTRASRERVQMLEGVLPTCSFCKDIRNDEGEWERIEAYLSRYSTAQFSHGICPPCADKHYGMDKLRAASREREERRAAESVAGPVSEVV